MTIRDLSPLKPPLDGCEDPLFSDVRQAREKPHRDRELFTTDRHHNSETQRATIVAAAEEARLFSELRDAERQFERLGRDTDLSADEERGKTVPNDTLLAERVVAVKQELASRFFPLAISVARQVAGSSHELDDLIGTACLTLMRAIDLFDHRRGFRFSTYATRAMRSELQRFLVKQFKREQSMEPAMFSNLVDARVPSGLSEVKFEALEATVDRLAPRAREIVRARYGLRDQPGALTLQNLADQYGVSRERVRQIESAALEQLAELWLQNG